jgi:cytidyltransferase-like protein
MAIINVADLRKIRKQHKGERIVFCAGAFDLTHAGHVLFLEDCKKEGDILVVEVGCDHNIKQYKSDERPILTETVRSKLVDSLKPVDYCFIDTPMGDAYILDFLKIVFTNLSPDVYVINTDAFDIPYRKKLLKVYPSIELIIKDRFCPPEYDSVSSSSIIEKIKGV